jgi:hypothetical protein
MGSDLDIFGEYVDSISGFAAGEQVWKSRRYGSSVRPVRKLLKSQNSAKILHVNPV